ncbi:Lrp/AsnC family transcriptional regulator [Acidomonas methanolica]|uniref:Transcriptional regulator Lrp/AsnC n=1 Tax=Acidomonas methanolica NBRC 104435 TaxID=1231351 RepID=A0A023D4V1_ACIMT|nr:Lrp/AsnC family transcriptional regulator [Acidomonas methanolica]MBU2653644.1 Lrp/AsnC family transcriptional regulator [Acidomonas methanolica]TCS31596.1 DNA-binding Lrp family transcriptional regulator [Acidomonas methanolica]GAJ28810.1 transcriptional regulator Lrp/AsnC [Acidomonas methanolica NBRC 104435]GBQ49362.1 AsnC family transcriptional regulator [Acidomonas methanolica]GEK98014.1 AsnC family transcriptional regulator [Acidomonas methanolica NBRC 104435]
MIDRDSEDRPALQRGAPGGGAVIELDVIDRQIVDELQRDGRMTNVELARRTGISAPPCLRRVRRLEEAGIIRGFHAEVDASLLGWSLMLFALIGLESQKGSVLEAFEAEVAEWPEVRECHMIRGGGDFLVRLVARDAAHQNLLTRRLTEVPHVVRVQTLQTIRTSLDRAGVPL